MVQMPTDATLQALHAPPSHRLANLTALRLPSLLPCLRRFVGLASAPRSATASWQDTPASSGADRKPLAIILEPAR